MARWITTDSPAYGSPRARAMPTPLSSYLPRDAFDSVSRDAYPEVRTYARSSTPARSLFHEPPSPYTPRRQFNVERGIQLASRRAPSMVKDPMAPFLPSVRQSMAETLCLILDLDETLIYARDGPIVSRPYLDEFFEGLYNKDVEVVVWTAGERDYAQSVLRRIDPLGVVKHCVYRHPKWWTGEKGYSKDLRALGRNMSRVLMVENTPDCLRLQPECGILVRDFTGGRNTDDTLLHVLRVVLDGIDQRHVSIPVLLDSHPSLSRVAVDCDNSGRIAAFTLNQDAQYLSSSTYHLSHFNRDFPSPSECRYSRPRSATPSAYRRW
jgi:RNA polymerase II subunit A small phosphatase-like protein